MTSKKSRVTGLLLLHLLSILAMGLGACATKRPVKDTEEAFCGPTVYGQVSVSVDHVSVR